MIRHVFGLLVVAAVASAQHGISFSRSVQGGPPNANGYLGITPGCSSTDQFGSNNCNLAWGSTVTIVGNYSLNEDLTAGSTLSLNLKVDKILPLKTTCPMCGGNCTIDIAAIKQKISFPMPDCPIAKGAGALKSTTITLPKDPLQKGKVSLDGTISIIDQKQAVVANIVLHANIS